MFCLSQQRLMCALSPDKAILLPLPVNPVLPSRSIGTFSKSGLLCLPEALQLPAIRSEISSSEKQISDSFLVFFSSLGTSLRLFISRIPSYPKNGFETASPVEFARASAVISPKKGNHELLILKRHRNVPDLQAPATS
jgi:hypothetical protein